MSKFKFTLEKWTQDDSYWEYTVVVTPGFAGGEEDPLSLSIEKWKFIVETLREHPNTRIHDGGTQTCALCVHCPAGCESCPVMNATGKWDCRGTPYQVWADERTMVAAQAELEFLRGLKEDERE